jgi:hypothetical protein
MGTVFEAILGWIFTALLRLLLWTVAIPVGCLLMTPIVLIRARSGGGSYGKNVLAGYKKVLAWFLGSFLHEVSH